MGEIAVYHVSPATRHGMSTVEKELITGVARTLRNRCDLSMESILAVPLAVAMDLAVRIVQNEQGPWWYGQVTCWVCGKQWSAVWAEGETQVRCRHCAIISGVPEEDPQQVRLRTDIAE